MRKKKTPAAPKKASGGNGKIPDHVLVHRGLVQNTIQALTTKDQFLNPQMVTALVTELSKLLSPQLHEQPMPMPMPVAEEKQDKTD